MPSAVLWVRWRSKYDQTPNFSSKVDEQEEEEEEEKEEERRRRKGGGGARSHEEERVWRLVRSSAQPSTVQAH